MPQPARREILAAIAAETADRSGPMPAWLVPVAVNAKDKAASNAVDAELVAMRSAGLIDYHRNGGASSGLELTEAGRRALRELNQGKPARAVPQPDAKPKPAAATEPTPTPFNAELARLACRAIDPEIVEHEHQPDLHGLLCELGELVGECLAEARRTENLTEIARLRRLGTQLLEHTQRGHA